MWDFVELLADAADDGGSWWDNLNPATWIDGMVKAAYRGVKRFFCWLLLWCLTACGQLFVGLLSRLPAPPEYIATLLNWYALLNAWIPVDAFMWCAVTYYTFCAAIAAFRFVKSFIPTLGG